MSEAQEKDPWPRYVYCPCDKGHQIVVDLINEHQLPVTLDSNECIPHSELRVTRGEIVTGADRIMNDLRKRFAHLITTMPS